MAGAINGTIIGGAATMGTAQLAYSVGVSAWWFTLGCGLGLIILAVFYSRPLRQTGLSTIPQYLVLHYGTKAGVLASIASSAGIFFSIVASMLTAIHLLAAIFGLTHGLAVNLMVLIVLGYVLFGGLQGTGLSGNLKIILIYVTLFAAGWQAYEALAGWQGLQRDFPAYPWLHMFGRGLRVDVENVLSLVVGILCTQTYVQAVYAARDARTAVVGVLIAAAITIPVGLPSVFIGLYMQAHYPDIPAIMALPLYVIRHLEPWLGGPALGALLFSAVGSVAGLALGVGTMLAHDLFGGAKTSLRDRGMLWLNRAIVLAVTLGSAAFAYCQLQSLVLQWNFLSMALRGAGIFLPLTLAVFWPGRIGPKLAFGAMAAGVAVSLLWTVASPQSNPLFAGVAASLAVVAGGRIRW